MGINFGGFVPLSTVDWRGRSACVIFFRGCPARCWFCHNPHLQKSFGGTSKEYSIKSCKEILEMVYDSKMLISGVVLSGGEPTMQESIIELADQLKIAGYDVALHTSGVVPHILDELIQKGLVDKIALDIKTSWGKNHENYDKLMGGYLGYHVSKSLKMCQFYFRNGMIPEFEVVTTLFRDYNVSELPKIKRYLDSDTKWVLNQGIYKEIEPLTTKELIEIANKLKREVYIRTREDGEFKYEKGM